MVGVIFVSFLVFTISIPDTDTLRDREIIESTKIYDRTGDVLLYEVYNEEKRTSIPFEKIPRNVKNATIAIEDSHFYTHAGISIPSIIRSFLTDLAHGRFLYAGGSTITQQLVKNALLTSEKTLTRKIKEGVLAIKIERRYTKDEILHLYLNEIPYGSNAYGVEAASQTFFGKSAETITLAEAAYLAALPKAPSYYSPYGNHTNELEARKNSVLTRMKDLGFITDEDEKSAKKERVIFLTPTHLGIRSPHFVMYVLEQLTEQYGEEFLRSQGLVVRTTLNTTLQNYAEEIIKKHAPIIEKDFNATNAGLIAINPKNGEILAMVGSRDYFDKKNEGNFNVTTANRQPGSAFKPLVYAAALEKGYTPETVVFDVPTEFATGDALSYQPQNYDSVFRGPVTLREALAQSVNIPAVKVLYLTGISEALTFARRLGITTLAGKNQYGLTLVLGGGEVRLLELVSAYGVFAAEGSRNAPISITRIERVSGDLIWEHKQKSEQVIDAEIARSISNILSDNAARTPAFGATSALLVPGYETAVKTGTTNDYRDAWILGYTPSLAVGVWAGNNNNTPMEKRVAGFIVAPIWNDFMTRALQEVPQETFTQPQKSVIEKLVLAGEWRGGRIYEIDKESGKRATDQTPLELREKRVIPEIHSILYWVDKNNPRGPIPEHPEYDPQFKNWESGVRAWAEQHAILETEQQPPDAYDDIHTEKNKPHITIQTPAHNSRIGRDQPLTIRIGIENVYPLTQIDYFVGNIFAGSSKKDFSEFILDPSLYPETEQMVIYIKAYDAVGNKGEMELLITLS